MGKKGQSSTLRKQLKPKVARKKYRGFWKKMAVGKGKRRENEVKWLEAKAAEMRSELNHMKGAERKSMAKLRKLQRINSETKEANRQASINNARAQLYIHVMLHLLD